MKDIELVTLLLSALCLVAIGIRKKRIFADIYSSKMNENIDAIDIVLVLLTFIFFLLTVWSSIN